jgi:hypothetical protein
LHTWHREKGRSDGTIKTRDHAWVAGLHLAAYRHPRNHYGVILYPTLGYKRTNTRGAFFQTDISLSYTRVFLDGETYGVNSGGELQSTNGWQDLLKGLLSERNNPVCSKRITKRVFKKGV